MGLFDLAGSFANLFQNGTSSLDNLTVQIVSYNIDQDLYEVIGNGVQHWVKLQQLILLKAPSYIKLYPAAETLYGIHALSGDYQHTIVDLTSSVQETGPPAPTHVTVLMSCQLVGNKWSPVYKRSNAHVATLFTVNMESAHNVVEFQGLTFESTVTCKQGTVLFRNCVFRDGLTGVTVDSTRASVWFDRCEFRGQSECSLAVTTGFVTVDECWFIDAAVGITVCAGGNVNALDSRFTRGVAGVVAPNKGIVCIQSCTFEFLQDHCVLVDKFSRLRVEDTIMGDCPGNGIVLGEGSYTLVISSEFRECRVGLRIGSGFVDCELKRSKVRTCTVGMYIASDATGRSAVDQVEYINCGISYLNLGGDLLCATVNGAVETSGSQANRLLSSASLMADLEIDFAHL